MRQLAGADYGHLKMMVLAVDLTQTLYEAQHQAQGRGLQYLAAAAVSNIAALILADLKTVDGSGSGLDADLLDGQHGSYYAVGGVDFVNGAAGTQGYFTVPKEGTLIIPKGLYMMAGEPDTHLQVNYSGSWFGSAPSGGLVLSDGVNYRLKNVNLTSNTRVDYRKLA